MGRKKQISCSPLSPDQQCELDTYLRENARFLYSTAQLFLSNHEDIEDIIQDSLLVAMKHADIFFTFSKKRKNAFFARSICFLSIDLLRRKNRIQMTLLTPEVTDNLPSHTEEPPGSEAHLSVLALGMKLPERDWEILRKLYIEGRPIEEVAMDLGCSTDSVRCLASRARAAARKVLTTSPRRWKKNG